MLKDDLIMKNSLRVLNPAPGKDLLEYRLGLVVARAGLGKTAVLVQIALDSIFRGQKVLHVSIGEGLDKAKAWYDDIFNSIVTGLPLDQTCEIGQEIMRNRMIMTFKESSFSRPKLEERLNDLVYQNIFRPDCIVVDGFDFTVTDRQALEDIRELMKAMNLQVWFSALSHRDDTRISAAGVPAPCHEVDDLFDTVILIQPDKDELALNIVKDETGCAELGISLRLDPSTMVVRGS